MQMESEIRMERLRQEWLRSFLGSRIQQMELPLSEEEEVEEEE